MNLQELILITTCTHRKKQPIPDDLKATRLEEGSQEVVLTEWCKRVNNAKLLYMASEVYCGRAIKEALMASSAASSKLFIISAGMGLISSDTNIPCYNLTIGDSSDDSVVRKVSGIFSYQNWWLGINKAFRDTEFPIKAIVEQNPSISFVLAISSRYLDLISRDLLLLGDSDLRRIVLIGLGLRPMLEERLLNCFLPYDERLNNLEGYAGTRADFAPRAMKHFVMEIIANNNIKCLGDASRTIKDILSPLPFPKSRIRKNASDEEIINLIRIRLNVHPKMSASAMLRFLRDQEGIACEQGRLKKLFIKVQQNKEESK